MKYLLILQFSADSVVDFDPLVALETKLIEELGEIADVDGHDFGMGNFNIFVLTDEPTGAFTQAHHVILDEGIRNELRSAYRETNGEDYVVLWPPQRRDFEL
jgi:hypothetical protein